MVLLRNFFSRKSGNEKKILLYGLQRSGTNYLQSLLMLNYPDFKFVNGEERNNITHKHFRLYDNKSAIPEPQFYNMQTFLNFKDFESALPKNSIPNYYLIISKDPLSWYSSYLKWSIKNAWPKNAYHYLEEYQLFYSKWMEFSLQSNNIIFIQYADLLKHPEKTIQQLAAQMQMPLKENIKTTKKVYASRRFTEDKKKAFLNKAHVKDISNEEKEIIKSILKPNLLQFLGYSI